MENKGNWKVIASGYANFNEPTLGQDGGKRPDLNIILPDGQRMAVWLNLPKGRVFYQLTEDSPRYRESLAAQAAADANDPEFDDGLPF